MPESETSARKVTGAERARQAVELRKAGASYDEIARQCGYRSRSGAYKAVSGALRDLVAKTSLAADELRELETIRLDALNDALWSRALAGELPAIDRVIRLMERRAKLLGLDAPEQTELSGPGGGVIPVKVDDAREELVARLADIDRRRRARAGDTESDGSGSGGASV